MNEITAVKEGLYFTGHYSHNKEEMKVKAAKYRKQGYRAVVVTIPTSKYSRGYHDTGYGVYVENKFSIDERKKKLIAEMNDYESKKQKALEAYNSALCDLADKHLKYTEEYNRLKEGE